jgi:hypothetical protein
MLDHLLSDRDVEKIVKRARSTLQKDGVAGTGIPFIRIGRAVRYRSSDVAAYLDALPARRSTSETPQGAARSTSETPRDGEVLAAPIADPHALDLLTLRQYLVDRHLEDGNERRKPKPGL